MIRLFRIPRVVEFAALKSPPATFSCIVYINNNSAALKEGGRTPCVSGPVGATINCGGAAKLEYDRDYRTCSSFRERNRWIRDRAVLPGLVVTVRLARDRHSCCNRASDLRLRILDGYSNHHWQSGELPARLHGGRVPPAK